jgi:hypothetical protein
MPLRATRSWARLAPVSSGSTAALLTLWTAETLTTAGMTSCTIGAKLGADALPPGA